MTEEFATTPLSPLLTETEARVLGCLIEKAATTPEQYPLTANAVLLASNQKTSRDPIMSLELGEVGHTLRMLEDKKLVRVDQVGRAYRYEQRITEVYTLTGPQRAVLCMLLLRGPQTVSELFTRTERLAKFADLEQVRDTLDRLTRRQPALALKLARMSGQREERYMHLLCGPGHAEKAAAQMRHSDGDGAPANSGLADRVSALESEIERLRAALRELGADV